MANHIKSRPKFEFEACKADGLASHGGLVAIDAVAAEFGLWDKIKATATLDPRRDQKRGHSRSWSARSSSSACAVAAPGWPMPNGSVPTPRLPSFWA